MSIECTITLTNYRCFSIEKPATIRLNGVCALVGPNNGGKSAILRFFFEFRMIFLGLSNTDHWNHFFSGMRLNSPSPVSSAINQLKDVPDIDDIFSRASNGDLSIDILHDNAKTDELKKVRLILSRDEANLSLTGTFGDGSAFNEECFSSQNFHGLKVLVPNMQARVAWFARLFYILSNAFYCGSVRHILSSNSGASYDAQIGQNVIGQWVQLLGTTKGRATARALEVQLAKLFKFGELGITPSTSNTDFIIRRDGHDFLLSTMGTGIAQVLAIFINIVVRRSTFLLIDEPESSLHPALQIDFVRLLSTFAPDGILFSTHQLGLARETADFIFTVKPLKPGMSEVRESHPKARIPELMGELNYPSLRELGFTHVLLVEGITEIRVFDHFLDLFGKREKFIIISLGGDNMICKGRELELRELIEIVGGVPSNIVAVIDSERAMENAPLSPNRLDFISLCENLGIHCKVLDRRAIENYFPQHALNMAISVNCRELAPFEALSPPPIGWNKRKNSIIARQIGKADLENTDLGEWLKNF